MLLTSTAYLFFTMFLCLHGKMHERENKRERESSFHSCSNQRKNCDVNFPTFLQADFIGEVSHRNFVFFNFVLQKRDVPIQNDLERNMRFVN